MGGFSGPGESCFPNVGRDPGSIPSTLEQSICYSDADCKPHFKCSYTGYDPDQKDNYGICICGQDCNPPPNRRFMRETVGLEAADLDAIREDLVED
ncbi:MAG TPA: hypothetical protein VIX59_08765 [Candidatus Binataceae bacterium]